MKRSLIRMAGVVMGVAIGGMLSAFAAAVPSQSATFTVNGYKGASTLSDYPVLVRLSKAALTGGASATFSEDGADLRAYDASGNEIPHEIETWDPSGESAIWVRLPKLYGAISGTKTTFKLTWGGSPAVRTMSDKAVWSSGYGIVLHGGLDASNKGIESVTATALVSFGGTPTADTTDAVAGNAVTFNHASSKGTIPSTCFQSSSVAHGSTWLPLYVNPYGNTWQPNWPFTISGWFKLSSCTDGTSNLIRLPFASGTKSALTVTVKNSSTLKFTITRSGSGTRDYSLDGASVKSDWVHLAISSFEYGDMVRVYVNGKALRGHCVGEYMMAEAEGAPLYFAEKMSGQLDELRITKQPQTPDSLLAEYETMADASFCAGVYGTPSATVTAPTITAPANGTVMPLHTSVMTEFVGYTPTQRTTKIGEEDFRAAAAYPEPYNTQPALTLLEWSGSSPSWTVHVYDVTDAANATEVTLVPTVVTANRLALGQLKSGRNYRWTVANTSGQTAEGTFSTADVTPCPIYVSGKIANCRDMGGWTGVDGRRIRQGRVYRCSGFDDGKSPKTSFVDTESKRILVDVLGVKTDMDLRGNTSAGKSPLGTTINVVSLASGQYDEWDDYRSAFKTEFAAFLDASKYPIAIHCQDGQDRTGCTQFILGALLGMSEADLMLDYYWSCYWKYKFNEENKKFPLFLQVLDGYSGVDYAAKAVSWAKSRANVTDAQIATFREIMLEPAEEPDPVDPSVPTVAPSQLSPNGVTVETHTELQRAYLAMTEAERRTALSNTTYRATLAQNGSGSEPLPTELTWTGDGLCTVTVRRASDGKVVYETSLVGNATSVDQLEIADAYEWSVSNALGVATGSFETSDEAPRLLRNPGSNAIHGIRDLGGRIGLGGRRVKQNLIFRSSELNSENVNHITSVNRSFWLDELGVKTDLDFRIAEEERWDFASSSPLGAGVTYVGTEIGSYRNFFVAASALKVALKTALDPANYPLVFHCVLGQDRTGSFAYLLNAVLGVDEQELMKDWEATAFWNTSSTMRYRVNDRLDAFRAELRKFAPDGTPCEQAYAFLRSIGIGESEIAAFRNNLLEGGWEPAVVKTPNADGWTTSYELDGTDYEVVAFTNTAAVREWTVPAGVSAVDLLVVGGGGAGGGCWQADNVKEIGGGGGGGGGYQLVTAKAVTAGEVLSVKVGAGGAATTAASGEGGASYVSNSVWAAGVLSSGGGAGASNTKAATSGASGGGGCGTTLAAAAANGLGAGHAGGAGGVYPNNWIGGGGGGGAGTVGGAAVQSTGGDGGCGIVCDLSGELVAYAGGGGGAGGDDRGGIGGAGGGGTGGGRDGAAGSDGVDGFGGGGGGSVAFKATRAGGRGGSGIVIIRYTVSDTPVPTHVHVWAEASRIEPTCEAAGSVTSNCTGTGTCELGGTQVYALAALGHDLGDWYTHMEPQVGVAGEERRDCRREGCDHYESRALDPLPPPVVEPTERTVTAGAVTDGKLPLTFGAGTTDLLLFAVWGAADRGDNFYVKTGDGCWDGFTFVARIPAATTSYDFTLPEGWGTTVRYVRFFLTAVDGAPVSSLKSVSGTDGVAVLDTGYVPLPTATITAFVKMPAGTKNQTIFEVGTEGANNPYLVCNIYVNTDGNVAFNYRNSTKTSGWGCNRVHYDSEYKATTAVKSGEVMRWRIDGSRTKPLARYSDASGDYDAWDEGATTDKPTAPANGTVKFYGVGEITQATVMESTWTRYLMPSMVYDAAGNVVAGFYDSITHKTFASATAMPFTAGEADAYQRDLLNGVILYGDSGTIEYTAPTPTEHVHTWTETKRVAATQMEDGYVTYACTGAGTCDAGGTKTETLRHTGKFDTLYKTLQTDGTGYILTDCTPANLKTARVEIKARRLNALSGFFFMANGNTAKLAGKTAGSGELGLAYWAGVQFADGKAPGLQYYCTPGNVIFGRDFGDTVWAHTYDAQGANLTMDGETYAISGTASTGAAGGPLALFCWTLNGTSASGIASLRVQYIRVWNGTTLVRDWVPVTKDGVATLYDKVNDKCETVRGGGTFSADNEVDPDYADKPVNSWVRAPSLTPNPFTAGVAPTFDLGEAAYGTPTATYAAERLAQLDGGVYTQVVAVAETDAYRGLETSIVFTVSGQLSREATVAPAIVAPTVGATVLTHTELQRAYLAKSDDERRAAYVDATYRQTLANGKSGPLPTVLKWTGDGLTTVTVTRVTGTEKQFLRREVIGVRDAENELAIENLEIGTAYRWTVANGLGTATGTFTTDAEAPRLLRDPGPDTIRGIRDLGGRTGIDGRRVRQGLVFRSSQLGRETDASTYVNEVNRGFWLDFLKIRTELDFRSSSSEEAGGVTKSAIADSVQYRRCEIASYDFDSYDEYKAAFKLFLDESNYPIDFHCAAGQDRTGVFAFLLNALLGVSEDELQKDWEVTAFWNPSVDFCFANYDEFRANLRAAGGADAKTQAENFVINRLGLTTDDINTFRTIMLEPAEKPVDPVDPVDPSGEAFGTNAMANASWGYEIHGLGAASNEVALVFTNTAPAETMNWTVPDGVDKIWYLVVGGGGSGGNTGSNSNGAGGGGGGGGVVMNNAYSLTTPSSVLTITVGKGGKTSGGSQSQSTAGAKGGDSSLQVNSDSAIVAKGGGGGCSPKSGSNKSGGCGGGGAAATGDSWAASNAKGGTGSQGGKGGNSAASSGQTTAIAGGGGGAGADGGDADSTNHRSGDGGIGVECLITGESEYYAGGGGGGAGYNATIDPKAGNGGKGGGGNGGDRTKTANTGAGKNATSFGGGGGGSGANGTGEAYCGGSGYQGVVIIRYTRPQGEEPQTEKPKVDGKDVEPEAVFETATSTKPIVYPQGATVTVGGEVGAQTIAFGGKTVAVPRYYTATLATDGRTVALVLNDNVKPVFENEKGEVEKSGIVVASDGTVSLHITNVEPKLTYTLVASSSLDTPVENWEVIVSQKGAADFQDTSAKGDSRFYRVIVTDGE